MIVALAGRRVDAPDTKTPRFPLSLIDSVKVKLTTCLKNANATHLISSGACGADLLAMMAAEELLIPKTMILPFDAETFRSTSVTDRPGNWGLIYDTTVQDLKDSGQLIELNLDINDPEVYAKVNLHMLDLAQIVAEQTRLENGNKNNAAERIMALIVWEGTPKDADDTTYHFLKEAQKRNFVIKEILSTDE